MEGFLCPLLFKTGLYSWKHTSMECETLKSYFLFHNKYLYKTFILLCVTVAVSDKVIQGNKFFNWKNCQKKVRNKCIRKAVLKNNFSHQNMTHTLYFGVSLKTSSKYLSIKTIYIYQYS